MTIPVESGGTPVRVTCPGCGRPAGICGVLRRSEDFCPGCDYPLFWTPDVVRLAGGTPGEESLRRFPGTAGRVVSAFRPCPGCGEHNAPDAVRCLRCQALLDPPPVPSPPLPATVAAPPPAPPRRQRLWPWYAAAVAVVLFGLLLVMIPHLYGY